MFKTPQGAVFERDVKDTAEMGSLQLTLDQQQKAISDLEKKVDTTAEAAASITAGIAASKASMGNVGKLVDDVSGANKELTDTKKALYAQLAKIQTTTDTQITTSKATLDTLMDKLSGNVASTLKANKEASDKAIATMIKDAEDKTKPLTATLGKYAECAKKNMLYDGKKCVLAEPKAADVVPTVWHRGWDNQDGREGGYINNRWIKVKKVHDDTFFRVTYYDNMRVHGHGGCHGNWDVMFCPNGGSCHHCTAPGRCNIHRYHHHQHGWWMNDYSAGTLECICKSAGRALTAGNYELKVNLHWASCDLITGHDQHFGSLMVTEVNQLTA